jgi:hypothetical protein
MLSSKKKYEFFSMDTIKSILENSVYLDNFYKDVEQPLPLNNTLIENELYINLCFNVILKKCFEKFREFSLIVGWGECIVVPTKDTVKIGDFFEANIYFSIKDLSQTYIIEFDDGTIFKGDVYKEKTRTKGLNTRRGLFPFFNGETTLLYPVEFSYYVK